MSNAEVLLRQDDETVDVPQTSQHQESRPVVRGHKSQENGLARAGADRPALLVTLSGRTRRASARNNGNRGSHIASSQRRNERLGIRIAPLQGINWRRSLGR